MSGESLIAQGIPLTLSSSKGERNAFFNTLLTPIREKRGNRRYTPMNADTRFDAIHRRGHQMHSDELYGPLLSLQTL